MNLEIAANAFNRCNNIRIKVT